MPRSDFLCPAAAAFAWYNSIFSACVSALHLSGLFLIPFQKCAQASFSVSVIIPQRYMQPEKRQKIKKFNGKFATVKLFTIHLPDKRNNNMTPEEICTQHGIMPETLRKRFKTAWPGRAFSSSLVLTEEESQKLTEKKVAGKRKAESGKAPTESLPEKVAEPEIRPVSIMPEILHIPAAEQRKEPEKKKESRAVPWLLSAVIFSDLLMVAVGLWLLLAWVGVVVSIMVVASILAAKELSGNADTLGTSNAAIFVSFLLSCAGAFLHYNTLANELNIDTVQIGSQPVVCWCISITISGLSFAALWMTRNMTAEKMFL